MDNIVATTLATLYKFLVAYLFLLLCWMEMHRYAYLFWAAVLGVPAVKPDSQN
jgi:hypothetical protein